MRKVMKMRGLSKCVIGCFITSVLVFCYIGAKDQDPDFALKNSVPMPLYYAVRDQDPIPLPKDLTIFFWGGEETKPLQPGKIPYLLFSTSKSPNQYASGPNLGPNECALFTFSPGKTLYLKAIKTKLGRITIQPQLGKLSVKGRVTQRGYSLAKNIKQHEIKYVNILTYINFFGNFKLRNKIGREIFFALFKRPTNSKGWFPIKPIGKDSIIKGNIGKTTLGKGFKIFIKQNEKIAQFRFNPVSTPQPRTFYLDVVQKEGKIQLSPYQKEDYLFYPLNFNVTGKMFEKIEWKRAKSGWPSLGRKG